jgi:hypothetical protein
MMDDYHLLIVTFVFCLFLVACCLLVDVCFIILLVDDCFIISNLNSQCGMMVCVIFVVFFVSAAAVGTNLCCAIRVQNPARCYLISTGGCDIRSNLAPAAQIEIQMLRSRPNTFVLFA